MTSDERAADRARRARHGLAASTFATFAALLSHVIAGGGWPGWLGVLAPWILATTASALLAGRRPSLPRIAVSVTISQALFHTLFVLGSPSAASAAAHDHHAMVMPPIAAPAAHDDTAMWIGHAVAAVLTTAVLHRAELVWAILVRVARTLGTWFRRIVALTVPAASALPPRIADRTAPARTRLVDVSIRRRGPPLSLAA